MLKYAFNLPRLESKIRVENSRKKKVEDLKSPDLLENALDSYSKSFPEG